MRLIILCVLLSTLLVGCGKDDRYLYVCNCEQKKAVQEFVGSVTRDANNYSDEEMEDVINELYKVAVRTNCPKKVLSFGDNIYYLNNLPIPDSLTVMHGVY